MKVFKDEVKVATDGDRRSGNSEVIEAADCELKLEISVTCAGKAFVLTRLTRITSL